MVVVLEREGQATRGDVEDMRDELVRQLQAGEILIPQVQTERPNIAGGVNHCPNSDLSYSTLAATTAGTAPGTAGDTNQEAYSFYRQPKGGNLTIDSAHALKAVGHSTYAANEGATLAIPDWDRVNGWVEIGAASGTQYDIAIQLPAKLVGPGQRWYVRLRVAALNAALVPGDVQLFAGIWQKTATGEGYVQGTNFTLGHEVLGTPGATSIDYRVLAKTDSGVEILSDVLNVPDAPAALNSTDYVKLFFNPGPGFVEFEIYRKTGGVYRHIFTIRNSTDLQYNDTGIDVFGVVGGWPSVTQGAPQAYAETRSALIGAFGSEWKPNDLTIEVPPTYDFSQATAQFLRIGLTAPTGVGRHIGIDRIYFSTTYNEWSPDDPTKYASGPSISPTSGNQGSGGGVFDPPPGGGGGHTCVVVKTGIVTVTKGRRAVKQYQSVRVGDILKGEHRLPYVVLGKKQGVVSEFYEFRTGNGITIRCTVDHPFALSVAPRKRIQARHVEVGTRLACEVRGRKTLTTVVSKILIPRPAEVGTFTLRHVGGLQRDGDGMYLAGDSEGKDRALFCFNVKPMEGNF